MCDVVDLMDMVMGSEVYVESILVDLNERTFACLCIYLAFEEGLR